MYGTQTYQEFSVTNVRSYSASSLPAQPMTLFLIVQITVSFLDEKIQGSTEIRRMF